MSKTSKKLASLQKKKAFHLRCAGNAELEKVEEEAREDIQTTGSVSPKVIAKGALTVAFIAGAIVIALKSGKWAENYLENNPESVSEWKKLFYKYHEFTVSPFASEETRDLALRQQKRLLSFIYKTLYATISIGIWGVFIKALKLMSVGAIDLTGSLLSKMDVDKVEDDAKTEAMKNPARAVQKAEKITKGNLEISQREMANNLAKSS